MSRSQTAPLGGGIGAPAAAPEAAPEADAESELFASPGFMCGRDRLFEGGGLSLRVRLARPCADYRLNFDSYSTTHCFGVMRRQRSASSSTGTSSGFLKRTQLLPMSSFFGSRFAHSALNHASSAGSA